MPDSQRIALVTGASRGIGAAIAIELAKSGVHVVATARTQGGLEETDDRIRQAGGTATLLPLDLTDAAAIDRIGPSIHARFGRLDILIANAGALGTLTPVSHITDKDWAEVVAVNITANLHLIRTSAPLLQTAPAGRAVFLTTGVATKPRAYWAAYSATKAAMEHLALCWAAETKTTNLRINLFSPGPTRTRMRATAMPGEDPLTLPTPEDIAPHVVALCALDEARHGATVGPKGTIREA